MTNEEFEAEEAKILEPYPMIRKLVELTKAAVWHDPPGIYIDESFDDLAALEADLVRVFGQMEKPA